MTDCKLRIRAWNARDKRMFTFDQLIADPYLIVSALCDERFMGAGAAKIWYPMLWTQLVDSKGVDIYESDVLGRPRFDDSGVSPSSVVFEDGSFFKNYPGWDDSLPKPRLDKSGIKVLKLEVIGNFHANPELMEQQA